MKMNAMSFKNEIQRAVSGSPVDITLVKRWFDNILASLKVLHKQKATIEHPRHRGDAREADLTNVIRPMFPASIEFAKGFVLNKIAAHSREQDILLLDSSTASAVIQTDGCSYYPVESVLGSIEVKSRLNLVELRRAVINCIGIKKLLAPQSAAESPLGEINYVIFAYECEWDLQATAKRLNEAVVDVPVHLRPDAIYILGQGLLIPGSPKGLELKYRQSDRAEYQCLDSLRTEFIPPSEAYAFLWFITSIVDRCVKEKESRKSMSLFDYLMSPLLFQVTFERALKEKNPAGFQKILESQVSNE
jgi:hypothetical protein